MEKNIPASAEIRNLIFGSARSPGEGNDNPVILPEKSHGQRSLEVYSPWGRKIAGHD